MGKKITVIVPVYNTKKFLTRCVNSILKQSYENLEVIIIDDGSTDGSAQVCDELSKSDKRVRVIHQKIRNCNYKKYWNRKCNGILYFVCRFR